MSNSTTAVRPPLAPYLGLGVGIMAVSTAALFIRLAQAQMGALEIAAWRLTLASLLLAPAALLRCRTEWRALTRREWLLLVASGVFLALHFYTWIASMGMITAAASMALVSTNPLFVGVISHFFLKERMNRVMVVGMIIAVVGTAVIGGADWSAGRHYFAGDLLALAGAATVAAYMLIGRTLRARLSLLGYVFPVYATAALTLMLAAIITRAPLWGYPPPIWLWLFLLALLPQMIGHSAFNWALGHLPATYVALAVLAEPICSTALVWLALGETPPAAAVIGGALILVGIAVATRV